MNIIVFYPQNRFIPGTTQVGVSNMDYMYLEKHC